MNLPNKTGSEFRYFSIVTFIAGAMIARLFLNGEVMIFVYNTFKVDQPALITIPIIYGLISLILGFIWPKHLFLHGIILSTGAIVSWVLSGCFDNRSILGYALTWYLYGIHGLYAFVSGVVGNFVGALLRRLIHH